MLVSTLKFIFPWATDFPSNKDEALRITTISVNPHLWGTLSLGEVIEFPEVEQCFGDQPIHYHWMAEGSKPLSYVQAASLNNRAFEVFDKVVDTSTSQGTIRFVEVIAEVADDIEASVGEDEESTIDQLGHKEALELFFRGGIDETTGVPLISQLTDLNTSYKGTVSTFALEEILFFSMMGHMYRVYGGGYTPAFVELYDRLHALEFTEKIVDELSLKTNMHRAWLAAHNYAAQEDSEKSFDNWMQVNGIKPRSQEDNMALYAAYYQGIYHQKGTQKKSFHHWYTQWYATEHKASPSPLGQ